MAASRMTELLGRVLDGRYRLVEPIGRGASAQVYAADDVRLRRRVAVKVLHPALADDADFVRRFRAEAEAAAALDHPNLVRVHDWGIDDEGLPWLVLDLLTGGSLRSMLDAGHRLSPSQALGVGLDAARGLDHAHRRGFVHRDIKPANLLFDDEARLRIADFGLARALAEAAWTEPQGAVVGTARYASPEQAKGQRLTGAADVYSLALVLIEAVTGAVPFSSDTTYGTLMARIDRQLVVPEALGPLVPVLERAGTPDPEGRIGAQTLAMELRALAAEMPSPEPLPLVGLDTGAPSDADPTQHVTRPGRGASDPVVVPGPGRDRDHDDDHDDLDVPAFVSPAAMSTAGAAVGHDEPVDRTVVDVREPSTEELRTPRPVEAAATSTFVPAPAVEPGPAGPGGDDGGAYGEDEPRRRRWPKVLGVVVLVAALAAGAAVLISQLTETPVHAVPNVVGLTEAEARRDLVDLGFVVRRELTRRNDTQAGQVVDVRPARGTELEEGATVTLVVSEGQPILVLPADVAGKPEGDVTALLDGLGFTVTRTEEFSEDVAAGDVLRYADGTPAELERGSAVGIVVSKGPEPRTIPDGLVGAKAEDAAARLQDLGLEVRTTEEFSDEFEAGVVMAVAPEAGTQVPRGDTVELTVSRGPELVTVPDVSKAKTIDEAIAILEGAGLVAGDVRGPARGKPAGTDPPAGTEVRKGSVVDIILR